MADRKLNIGFIGCGRVADNHYKALKLCPQAELKSVSDLNKKIGQKKAKDWNVFFYENPDDLINNKEVDVVFILTPLETHYYYAKKVINNKKHVLVEKPISLNPEEIKELQILSELNDVVCFPGHSYLYLPEIVRMIDFIKDGVIEKPVYMYMSEIYQMPIELINIYHGPMIEVIWHSLYILIALFGLPSKVSGFSSCFRKEIMSNISDQIVVSAIFDEGAMAQIFTSWVIEDETSDPWTFKIKVFGTNGCVNFSRRDVVNETMKFDSKSSFPSYSQPLYGEMFKKEVDYFINRCILNDEKPLSSMEDAYFTSVLLNAVQYACANNVVVNLTEYINKKLFLKKER